MSKNPSHCTVPLKGVEMMGKGDNMTHVCYNDIEAGMNGWCATCDNKNNNSVIFSFFFIFIFTANQAYFPYINGSQEKKVFVTHFHAKLSETLCIMRYTFHTDTAFIFWRQL
jgi:hypothetical protein